VNLGLLDTLTNAAPPAVLLAVAMCTDLALIAVTVVVASLHPDPAHREATRKVLDLLFVMVRHRKSRR
jgi:hypothetical protein